MLISPAFDHVVYVFFYKTVPMNWLVVLLSVIYHFYLTLMCASYPFILE